jgi:3-oxoacyl-[acyl-carrier-protein] synthase-3
MPPNACLLQAALDLHDEVFAIDTNLACSGYVYSLALAQGLVMAKTCKNILLVTADTYSTYIHPGDRAARTLFGDGAAVSWISASDGKSGMVDVICATAGRKFKAFYIPAGGRRRPSSPATRTAITDANGNTRSDDTIHMDGMGVVAFLNARVPEQIRSLLARNEIGADDLDLVIFHQASQVALDSLTRALKLPADRVFNNLATVGNTVSASIPIALAEARATGRIASGSKVLLSGFGVGMSWASALLQA